MNVPPIRVLRVSCPDRPGLVHAITGILWQGGANVISNGEHVDGDENRFFMRTVFTGGPDDMALLPEVQKVVGDGMDCRLTVARRPRLALLVTREWHCLGDLLLRHHGGELPAEITGVVGNHRDLEDLTRRFAIPFRHVPAEGLTRGEHEDRLLEALKPFQPEMLVLAKYMRVLSPGFLAHWPEAVLNIHHSFLPAFAGAHPYRQAHARGVKVIGATAHFVTQDLDEGPIIAQDVIPVDHRQDAAEMARSGRDVERTVLARALRLVLEDRVLVYGRRTIIFDA